jgi:uncharacterized protein (TIRG00374 family)
MTEAAPEIKDLKDLQTGPKKPLWKRLAVLLAKICVSAGLLYLLLKDVPFTEAAAKEPGQSIEAMLGKVSIPLFIFAGCFHMVGYVITTFRWKVLLAGSGYRVRYFPLLISWVSAGFFNAIMPSIIGGDVLLMYYSSRYIGDGFRTAPIIFIARVTGITALIMICGVAILFKLSTLMTQASELTLFWLFPVFFALGVICLVIAVQPRVAAGIENLIDRIPVVRKFGGKFKLIFATFRVYRNRKKHLFAALGLSVLFQLNIVFYYYVCTVALGLGAQAVNVFVGAPIVLMLMMLPISIGGIGVRSWGFQKLVELKPGQGIMMEMIDVFWRTFYGLLGGLFLLIRKRRPGEAGGWVIEKEEVEAPDLSAFTRGIPQQENDSPS